MSNKEELKEAFKSAESVGEMLKKMRQMEKCLPESELGMECWALARKLNDPDKILYFGIRALNIFLAKQNNNNNIINEPEDDHYLTHGFSFFIPCVLNLLGSASLDFEMYAEGLGYLDRAHKGLTGLFEAGGNGCRDNCVLLALLVTHQVLFKVNLAMGKGNEALVNAKKVLEIREKTMEGDCIEIGEANSDVGVAYLGVKNFSEALPFTLKAMEIYEKCVRDDSEELALVRKNLEVIYGELGEHEKVFEIYKKRVGDNSMELALVRRNVEVVHGDDELGEDEDVEVIYGGARDTGSGSTTQCTSEMMQTATRLLALGLNEEAIEVLKEVISLAETDGNHEVRAASFVFIARGECNQGKFAEAKRYMKLALRILEKNEIDPLIRATAFEDMSKLYETMDEYENAMSYLKRALAIPELPQDRLIRSSTRFFSLISDSGKHKREISYLNELVGRLKEKLGPEHVQVGFGYINLGLGYMLSGKPEAAAEVYVLAKDAFDVSLGPHNLDSLRTSQTISVIYARLGRYEPATAIQESVIKNLRGLQGSSAQDFENIAVNLLENMKKKVAGPISWKVLSLKMAEVTLQRFESLPKQKKARDCDCLESMIMLLFKLVFNR